MGRRREAAGEGERSRTHWGHFESSRQHPHCSVNGAQEEEDKEGARSGEGCSRGAARKGAGGSCRSGGGATAADRGGEGPHSRRGGEETPHRGGRATQRGEQCVRPLVPGPQGRLQGGQGGNQTVE